MSLRIASIIIATALYDMPQRHFDMFIRLINPHQAAIFWSGMDIAEFRKGFLHTKMAYDFLKVSSLICPFK